MPITNEPQNNKIEEEQNNMENTSSTPPVVESPVVESPVVEPPVVESPVVESPVVEPPVVESPVVESPVIESPVVEPPSEDAVRLGNAAIRAFQAIAEEIARKPEESTQKADAGSLFLEKFQQFSKEAAEKQQVQADVFKKEVFGRLEQTHASFMSDMAELECRLKKQLDSIHTGLSDIKENDEIMRKMHKELTEHRLGMKQELLKPFIKSMIGIQERIQSVANVYSKKFEQVENLPQEAKDLLTEVNGCICAVLNVLDQHDIVMIEVKAGDVFDANKHNCIGTRDWDQCEEKPKERIIAGVEKNGFYNRKTGIVLSYTDVIVYK